MRKTLAVILAVTSMRHLILYSLTLFTADISGQEKNCNTFSIREKPVTCTLAPIATNLDTTISYLGHGCNDWKYPAVANGIWKVYRSDSFSIAEIVHFRSGRRHGPTVEFYENQLTAEESHYKRGILTGPYKSYYENGKLRLDGEMRKSQFTGTIYSYWDNGKLARKEFVDDKNYFSPVRVAFWGPDGQPLDEDNFRKLWDCK